MTAASVGPWAASAMRDQLDEAIAIYCVAMEYPAQIGIARRGQITQHTSLAGFRATAVRDAGGQLVGFGYGYTGTPGQWWHDQVARGLDDAGQRLWLKDCFELCELHLLPAWQGHGLGRTMLDDLLTECPHRTVLLSTPEGDGRAWRLYRAAGFIDVLREFRFVGDTRDFAVLGLSLPRDQPNGRPLGRDTDLL